MHLLRGSNASESCVRLSLLLVVLFLGQGVLLHVISGDLASLA